MTTTELLERRGLTIIEVAPDGYCLLRAVQRVLQEEAGIDTSMADIKQRIKSEVLAFRDSYQKFHINDSQSGLDILGELDAYLERGIYDMNIGDICISAVCNALHITPKQCAITGPVH